MGVGPSTKETSLHHFRDPLLDIVSSDADLDLMGVIVVGTPQDNKDKHFVTTRAAVWAESMRADGVIVSTDGWGNTNVDFASMIEELGKRHIPVVGMSFVGTQAKFVVTNKYMDAIVDFNKSESGTETTVVGENNLDSLDARKAVAMLKLKMKKKAVEK